MPAIPDPELSQAIDDYLAAQLEKSKVAIPTEAFWNDVLLREPMQAGEEIPISYYKALYPSAKAADYPDVQYDAPGTLDQNQIKSLAKKLSREIRI